MKFARNSALVVLLLAAIAFGYWRYTKRPSTATAIESLAVMLFYNAN